MLTTLAAGAANESRFLHFSGKLKSGNHCPTLPRTWKREQTGWQWLPGTRTAHQLIRDEKSLFFPPLVFFFVVVVDSVSEERRGKELTLSIFGQWMMNRWLNVIPRAATPYPPLGSFFLFSSYLQAVHFTPIVLQYRVESRNAHGRSPHVYRKIHLTKGSGRSKKKITRNRLTLPTRSLLFRVQCGGRRRLNDLMRQRSPIAKVPTHSQTRIVMPFDLSHDASSEKASRSFFLCFVSQTRYDAVYIKERICWCSFPPTPEKQAFEWNRARISQEKRNKTCSKKQVFCCCLFIIISLRRRRRRRYVEETRESAEFRQECLL